MVCAINKIDSNITASYIAEEVCFKELPTTAVDGFEPTWYALKPNSYSDFGGDLTMVARSPIDPSRQNQKGAVTDLDASGGFSMDYTSGNFTRLSQGFFFADARQPASTMPLNGTSVDLTAATTGPNTFTAASGLGIFAAGQLVYVTGMGIAGNNGVKTTTAATATVLTVSETLAAEASPPAAAKIERVGFQFASADINVAVVSGIPSLISTVMDFTTLTDLIPGKWVYLGDDTLANRFVNNNGYARIKTVAANSLTFDDTTFTAVNETGTGKTIRLYVGTTVRNEKLPSLIKRRSYNIERQLGEGATSTQAEYLEGAVPNELTLNIPSAELVTVDLSFVAANNTYRSGDVDDEIKDGTRVIESDGVAYNTTSNIVRLKLAVVDPSSSNPTSLFGYATEAEITINNGITPNKAIGVLGAFDTSAANFEVGGSVEVYFTTVAAVQAVRNNADVSFNIIGASRNTGFVFDIPLLGLGGGRVNVEKDAPVMLPLETAGAENPLGYTLQYDNFPYLPTRAMPV